VGRDIPVHVALVEPVHRDQQHVSTPATVVITLMVVGSLAGPRGRRAGTGDGDRDGAEHTDTEGERAAGVMVHGGSFDGDRTAPSRPLQAGSGLG